MGHAVVKIIGDYLDFPRKNLQMKKNGKMLSRRITSEVIEEIPSSECYHREESGGIPFMWESQPGTPKLKVREAPLPPLTPPPSYLPATPKRPIKSHSKQQKLLYSVFSKLTLKKIHIIPRSPASTSSSSSASWSSSSSYQRRVGVLSSLGFSYDSQVHDEDNHHKNASPVSTLCFGGGSRGTNGRKRGCYFGMIKLLRGD